MSFDPETARLVEEDAPRFNPRGKLTLVEEGPTVSGRAGLLGEIPAPSFMQLGTTRLPTPPENVEVSRIPSEAEQQAMLTGVAQPETGFPSVPKLDKETLTTLGVPEAAAKPIAGAQQAIASVADFFMTPWGVATLGIGGLAPEAGKAFAAAYVEQMAESAPEQFAGAYQKLKQGDTEGAARDLTGGLAAIGFVGHALAPHVKVAIERAKNQIAASRVGEPDLAAADVAARQASQIRDTAGEVIPQPELPPLPIAKEPTPETQPLPKQLSEEDVQRLFLEPEAKRVEEELAKGAPSPEPALPVEHETVLPTATDAFKEIVSEAPEEEVQAPVAPQVEPAPKANPLSELDRRIQDAEAGLWSLEGLDKGFLDLMRAKAKEAGWTDEEYAKNIEDALGKLTAKTVPSEPTPAPKVEPAAPPQEVSESPSVSPVEPTPVETKGDAKVDTIAGKMDLNEFEKKGYAPEQVTKQNWIDLQRAERRRLGQQEGGDNPNAPWIEYEQFHRDAVKSALDRGEEVDPEVLADYPDLQQKSEPKPAVTEGGATETAGEAVKPSETPPQGQLLVRYGQSNRQLERQHQAFKDAGIPLRSRGAFTLGSKALAGVIPDTPEARALAKKMGMTIARDQPDYLKPKSVTEKPTEPPLQSMGGALHGEDLGSQGNVVSNMFAAIDRDRAAMGKPPMEPGQPRTWGEDQQRAMARMNRDPNWTTDLINEVLDRPRPLLSWEHAGLVLQKAYWKAEENNAASRISRAFDDGRTDDLVEAKADQARFEDNLERLERAVRRGGTGSEAGRTLQAQKMGLTDDLSLIEMRLGVRAKAGGRRLTEQESNQLEKIHAEYQENLKKITAQAQASERAAVEANARASLAELARQAAETKVPPPHIQTIIKRIGDVIHSQANKARERLKGKLFTIGDPEVLLDLARVGADNIWTIGEDFARWSAKMIEDLGDRIKPHLQQVWKASKKFIEDTTDAESGAKKAARGSKQEKVAETVKATIKKGDTPEQKIGKLTARIEDRVNKGQKLKIGSSVQALARSFMEQGIRDRDEVVKAVHEVLERVIPDWTLYDTKQAISGYGDYKTLTKDEISVALRDVKGQLQQILKLEDMARGEAPLKTGRERREVTKAQSELIKLVNEAKRKGGYTTTDPEKQLRTALDEVKKRTQTSIDEYERRLRDKDFSVRKLEPVRPDPELLSLQADQKRIKKKYEQVKRDVELANRTAWQKTLDKFVRWERAFKLSSPVVFGKLTAAAITRVATTGVEEAVGSVARFLPGLSKVAEQAPREGTGLSVPMFAKALAKAITEGMKDAAQTLTKGAADIDVEYGEKLVDKDWVNVFGQLHGMLKAPIKRAEFEYSLAKRIEFAQKHGVDVTDKLEMARLSAEALNDGYRAIFMQHGFSSDMFNQLVSQMERSTKYPVAGEISARVARFLLPVVRVPANIVAETATGIHGTATASARVMFHAIKGTLSNLKPEVADSIMRQFKKGSIGLGLMAIGYLNPQVVGGYDWREKRRPGAAKTAGFQVKELAGVWPVDDQGNVPRWLTHAPWFELMQFGATLRHVKDQHVKGQEKGIGEGLWAAGLGLVEETPLVNEMLHVDRVFDPAKRDQFLGELGRSTLIPQAMQKYAEWQDDFTQRKPKGVLQNIEMGVPYLRKNVPLKPPPGTTRNFVPVRAY